MFSFLAFHKDMANAPFFRSLWKRTWTFALDEEVSPFGTPIPYNANVVSTQSSAMFEREVGR
jgi:hypothetical protein